MRIKGSVGNIWYTEVFGAFNARVVSIAARKARRNVVLSIPKPIRACKTCNCSHFVNPTFGAAPRWFGAATARPARRAVNEPICATARPSLKHRRVAPRLSAQFLPNHSSGIRARRVRAFPLLHRPATLHRRARSVCGDRSNCISD